MVSLEFLAELKIAFALEDAEMPTPLLTGYPDDYPAEEFSEGLRDADPELLALAMKIVATWSLIDLQVATTLAPCFEAEAAKVFEVISAVGSGPGRRAAIQKAIEIKLADRNEEKDLIVRFLERLGELREEKRARFTHHLITSSPSIEDALIVMDPVTVGRAEVEGGPGSGPYAREGALVYHRDDLEKELAEAVVIARLAGNLAVLITYPLPTDIGESIAQSLNEWLD